MTGATLLAVALMLDAALGEPPALWSSLPHPAVLMGRLIGWADRRFNPGAGRAARWRGTLLTAALVTGAALIGMAIAALPGLGPVLEVGIAAILLAQRSLADHVRDVATALRTGLPEGRAAVARIVGRDTAAMDGPAISRAAIESGAENLSDGVIAPALWFLIAGLPGILVYKAVNTADSMIGYRTPRHADFGRAAARLDDLLNLIPARLTAALILLAAGRPRAWPAVARDARLHRSPNAGWPEAAMAIALDLALSGPRSYHGERRDFPWVHPQGRRDPGPAEIARAVSMLWRVWALALAATLVLALL